MFLHQVNIMFGILIIIFHAQYFTLRAKTKRILKFRLADHRGYVNNQDYTTATGEHFNSPGHSLSDLSITILERVKSNDDLYRKEREKYHIRKFNTYYKGLNKQPWNKRGDKRVALVITYIVSYYLINDMVDSKGWNLEKRTKKTFGR